MEHFVSTSHSAVDKMIADTICHRLESAAMPYYKLAAEHHEALPEKKLTELGSPAAR